jgi:hypothetical protein
MAVNRIISPCFKLPEDFRSDRAKGIDAAEQFACVATVFTILF